MPRGQTHWLVVPPPPLRPLRTRRLLRLLAQPACPRPLPAERAPLHPELRTGRGMVLGLSDAGLLRRPSTGVVQLLWSVRPPEPEAWSPGRVPTLHAPLGPRSARVRKPSGVVAAAPVGLG